MVAPGAPENYEMELARFVRLKRMQAAAGMAGISLPGEGHTMPQTTTVQDLLNINKEVREANKDIADAAKAQAEEERGRRQEWEERAGSAFEAGRQEAGQLHVAQMEMFKTFATSQLEALKTAYEGQAKLRQDYEERLRKTEMESLTQRLDAIEERARAELTHKDEEIAGLQKRLSAATQKKSLEETVAEHLVTGNLPALRAQLGPFLGTPEAPRDEDPELMYQKNLAPGLAEVHVQQAREASEDARAQKQAVVRLLDTATNTVAGLKTYLPAFLAGVAPRPDTVVPQTWDKEPPEEAEPN